MVEIRTHNNKPDSDLPTVRCPKCRRILFQALLPLHAMIRCPKCRWWVTIMPDTEGKR